MQVRSRLPASVRAAFIILLVLCSAFLVRGAAAQTLAQAASLPSRLTVDWTIHAAAAANLDNPEWFDVTFHLTGDFIADSSFRYWAQNARYTYSGQYGADRPDDGYVNHGVMNGSGVFTGTDSTFAWIWDPYQPSFDGVFQGDFSGVFQNDPDSPEVPASGHWILPAYLGSQAKLRPDGKLDISLSRTGPFRIQMAAPAAVIRAADVFSGGGTLEAGSLIQAGVDANGDGEIATDSGSDRTDAAHPYWFWINDDHDVLSSTEVEYQHDEIARGNFDYLHDAIGCTRDLEDFERLHLRIPGGIDLSDPRWSVRLSLSGSSKNERPAVNVWPALTAGTEYLTDPGIASRYISQHVRRLQIVGSAEIVVPATLFRDGLCTLLFDGRTAGSGAFKVRLLNAGKEVASDRVYVDLRSISDRYEYFTVGDNNTTPLDKIPNDYRRVRSRTVPATPRSRATCSSSMGGG